MTDEIILQLITTIIVYCNGPGTDGFTTSTDCFKQLWKCGHEVTTPSVIVSETHNCITDRILGKKRK